MTKKSKVCSRHFKKEEIMLTDDTVLPVGSIHKIPRLRAKMKKGVEPTIFGDYPQYYHNENKKRKSSTKRQMPLKIPKKRKVDEALPAEENNQDSFDDVQQCAVPSVHDEELPTVANKDQWIETQIQQIKLPLGWSVCNTLDSLIKVAIHINEKIMIDKKITFKSNETPEIHIGPAALKPDHDLPLCIKNNEQAEALILEVDKLKVCNGTGLTVKPYSVACRGSSGTSKRCAACFKERDKQQKIAIRLQKMEKRANQKKAKIKSRLQSLSRSKQTLMRKLRRYRIKICEAMRQCEKRSEDVLNEAIAELPQVQQEAVKACFSAAKRKSPSGRRYTIEWLYECILMKIKNTSLYNHIRDHNILPLPSRSTINGYIRNFSGAFGFQPSTFQLLKERVAELPEEERHGTVPVDEMKLTPGFHFDPSSLKMEGFVDFGKETEDTLGAEFHSKVQDALNALPEDPQGRQRAKRKETKNQTKKNSKDHSLGDHALVISYQPLRGKWVQPLACFLTKGNADAEKLTKLVLEEVLLLENTGLYAHGVITDGATWNRAMWSKFGVTAQNTSCEHPCDPSRKLWFFSDFPHLMKCMRNCFVSNEVIETPKGDIKLDHWKAVERADSLHAIGLRECPRYTEDHHKPDSSQKMKVAMAWQFWSASMAAGMQSYSLQGVEELEDCAVSSSFCKLTNDMADVMNSNRPMNALRPNSKESEVIQEFLKKFNSIKKYQTEKLRHVLEKAENARIAFLQKQGKKPRRNTKIEAKEAFVFSESTDIGLVTLNNTLEITEYLSEKHGFKYVMTARLNQDCLERFFGLVRQSCGANTHPEPRVFTQLFRLLSIYSLVKPIKGSNITGGELLTSLFNLKDIRAKSKQDRRDELCRRLDDIILNGENLQHIPELMSQVDHEYLGESVDEFALSYVGGFTARHSEKYTNGCKDCQNCLKKTAAECNDVDMLITFKTKGFLTYPSDNLVSLLRLLEKSVIQACLHNEMEQNIIFRVLDRMQDVAVTQVGCEAHKSELTKSVMKFYLIMRMHFVCRRWNTQNKEKKKQQKSSRKIAHLT